MPGILDTIINGYQYSFVSIEFTVNALKVKGISELNYSHSIEQGELRGTSQIRLGRTKGDYSAEGSFKISRNGFDALVASLSILEPSGWMNAIFPISVTYAEKLRLPVTDVLQGCRMIAPSHTNAQGTDPTMIDVGLDIQLIKPNGVAPIRELPI